MWKWKLVLPPHSAFLFPFNWFPQRVGTRYISQRSARGQSALLDLNMFNLSQGGINPSGLRPGYYAEVIFIGPLYQAYANNDFDINLSSSVVLQRVGEVKITEKGGQYPVVVTCSPSKVQKFQDGVSEYILVSPRPNLNK